MTEYKLYLGTLYSHITPALDSFFDREVNPKLEAYTITRGRGMWKGHPEDSLILTVIGGASTEGVVREIAKSYAEYFDQEAVYLTAAPLSTAELVLGDKGLGQGARVSQPTRPTLGVIQ